MNAAELLTELQARGVRFSVEGERLLYDAPPGVMQPTDLEQLRTHKAELLKALAIDTKAPENEAVAMLRQHPELSHAFATTDTDDPDYVHVVVVIRNKATCRLRIPRDKYDGCALLKWIEQHINGEPQ